MNNQRMTFDIDRHTVTEGDVVEVKWQCAEAENVVLTLDNGFRSTDIPLENTGSKVSASIAPKDAQGSP